MLLSLLIFIVVYPNFRTETNNNIQTYEDEEEEIIRHGIGLPNPSAVYCIENDGRYIIEDSEDGQIGICIFDDGSRCKGGDYYAGECEKGDFF